MRKIPEPRKIAAGASRAAKPPVARKPRPELRDFATPARNPLPAPDNRKPLQQAIEDDATALQLAFREQRKAEAASGKLRNDFGFYFVVCFDTSEQSRAFLAGAGLRGGGDIFIDGRILADALGIEIPESNLPAAPAAKVDKRLEALTR